MTQKLRYIISAVAALCFTLQLAGDATANPWMKQKHLIELGVYGGILLPPTDHEIFNPLESNPRQYNVVAPDFGLRVGYSPISWLGLEVEGGLMPTSVRNGDSALLYHIRGHLLAQYPGRFAPFIVAGGGLMGVTSDNGAVGNDIDPLFHWGFGGKYYATKNLGLRLDLRQNVGRRHPRGLTNHYEILFGLSYVLGYKEPPPPPDRDRDGIIDSQDKCPDVASDQPDGCPIGDEDGDGYDDKKDKCPKEKGVDPDGCPIPDMDGDGIPDSKDRCPREAAKTEDGCLVDSDRDGVPDVRDQCPNDPQVKENGCPVDSDGDGIEDDKDKCPKEPETKNGYQDTDGCPDELPKVLKQFTGAIRGINFAPAKATIRRSSVSLIGRAAKVLAEYPNLKLKIRGHTDNSGKHDKNVDLSLRRAQAVKDELVRMGIEEPRLTVEGLGPDEPVADNKSRKGRAENRRIEFVLVTQ